MSRPELIKEKDRFIDDSKAYRKKRFSGYRSLALANIGFFARYAFGGIGRARLFEAPYRLDPGFFAANCPPSLSTDLEDYMFQSLKEIGLRAVRVDWGYESDEEAVSRWLDRLIDSEFDVLLHLVQPASEASRMDERAPQRRWERFLEPILKRYSGKIRRIEIGSTPNRHSWSGYTIGDYVQTCRIAQDQANAHNFKLVGPNVSDFAPYFTIGVLSACRHAGITFDAMSDNLFVDRAGAPETFDPSVAGKALRNFAGMDLVGKSRFLATIAGHYKIGRTYSTYSYFTLSQSGKSRSSAKRPWRYVTPETYADYLVRYYVLSAAAGVLTRVYWGNLAGYYKGVINDGYRHRPDPPTVHHKFQNYGEIGDYERRPAFEAFKHLVRRLSNARFVRAHSRRDPFVFEFEKDGKPVIVAWSATEHATASSVVDEAVLSGAAVLSRDGRPLGAKTPMAFGASPVFILPHGE